MITAVSAIFAFATVVTLGLPMLDRNQLGQRMKAVSERREELRLRHHASLNKRGSLRSEPVSFMKATVERFKLSNILESEGTREKLTQAGKRGQAPLIAFMFFRFVMPPIVFLLALFYLFVMTHFAWTGFNKLLAAVGSGLLGFFMPDMFVSNMIQKRRSVHHEGLSRRARPDADLRRIRHVDRSRPSRKWPREIGQQSPELAEELALTTAELSYLPERSQAFDNLAKRCGHSGVKAVAAALNQAEHYGTPLGQALRVAAQENREMRMMEAEKKAAALPAKLTVPMILFFLPCLFVVILGPAVMRVMATFHH